MSHQVSSSYKSVGGIGRIFNAFRYSILGLRAALAHEAAFRQELLLVAVLTPMALWLGRTPIEVAILLGVLALVLIVELLNSAIEALADAISIEHHALLGRAKDIGSAAVMLSLLTAFGIWAAVLFERIAS
nr:diacylglycerol kinase [Pseudomonas sp.]